MSAARDLPSVTELEARLSRHRRRPIPRLLRPLVKLATRPASVVAPLFERDGRWHVLLVEKSEQLRKHAGQVAFPGGAEEPGDGGAWSTACREFEEETTVPASALRQLGELSTLPTLTGYSIRPFVAHLGEDPGAPISDSPEVARLLPLPVTDLLDRHAASFSTQHWHGFAFPDWRHRALEARIWGITGLMLVELLRVWTGQDPMRG